MTRRLPSLKQMEAFLAIEAARNLTEAANRLCVSQPALSRTLQLMEEALETRLFDRNARSVQLTDAGAMMLPIARRLMGEFREAFGIFDEYMEGHVGKVAVAGLSSVLAALVPGPARRFAVTAPGIRVELLGMLDQQVWEAVRAGSVDFGLATQPTSSTGLLFSPLVADEFVVLCRQDDPLAGQASVPWRKLAQRPFVALSASSSVRPAVDRVLVDLGIEVRVQCEANDIGLIGPLVSAGFGVTVVPRMALQLTHGDGLAAVKLSAPTTRRAIGLLQRIDLPLSPAARRLAEALRSGQR